MIPCDGIGDASFRPEDISGGDPAAVLYTSGTTGEPKGARITHTGLENMLEYYCRYVSLTERDKLSLFHSYGFDVHMESMFAPVIAG